ncbi:MAG: hypothetical protein HY817_05575 [Candidatus Abawacabacteria bacterium]|nr:hypothetical protein [Candidatus Abawacabacteria bacterium]
MFRFVEGQPELGLTLCEIWTAYREAQRKLAMLQNGKPIGEGLVNADAASLYWHIEYVFKRAFDLAMQKVSPGLRQQILTIFYSRVRLVILLNGAVLSPIHRKYLKELTSLVKEKRGEVWTLIAGKDPKTLGLGCQKRRFTTAKPPRRLKGVVKVPCIHQVHESLRAQWETSESQSA